MTTTTAESEIQSDNQGCLLKGLYVELPDSLHKPALATFRGVIAQTTVVALLAFGVPERMLEEVAVIEKPKVLKTEHVKLIIPPKPKPRKQESAQSQPAKNNPFQPPKAKPVGTVTPPSEPKNPLVIAPDETHQLPIVLARHNGGLVLGKADEPETYRLHLSGPGFRSRQPLAEPASVKDGPWFDVVLNHAELYQSVRDARDGCAECTGLVNVWAVFPEDFRNKLMTRLNEAAQNLPATRPLVIFFDSADPVGIVVRPSEEVRQ